MDADHITERLLWLEAQGLTIAAEARRLRRRVPTVPLVDEPELLREVAQLSLIAQSRRDELALWRGRPGPLAQVVAWLATLER